jgi:hypothetical protein
LLPEAIPSMVHPAQARMIDKTNYLIIGRSRWSQSSEIGQTNLPTPVRGGIFSVAPFTLQPKHLEVIDGTMGFSDEFLESHGVRSSSSDATFTTFV